MRSRRSANEHVAEVARRRLELLSAELAAIRPDPGAPPTPAVAGGSGEPTSSPARPAGSPLVTERGRHARRPAGVATGWVEDRLPSTLQGRVRFGASQLTVVAVMAAVGLGLLAWWSVRAADPGDLVPARSFTDGAPTTPASSLPSPSTASPVSAGAGAVSSGPSADEVVVDVAGKVRRPGIVSLPAGSRVVDAIDEAGGARRGVSLTGLNLARLLVDGEQVLVGVGAVPGVAPEAAASGGVASPGTPMVNLNTADADQLDTLPGVGPVTAAAILQWRAEHGAFSAVEELLEVSGIGDATLADLAPFVTL
jgi:competence protein ComEA